MFSQLESKIFGLATIKDQYVHDADFKDVMQNCKEGRMWNKFVVNDGFVFRANKLEFNIMIYESEILGIYIPDQVTL